MTRINQQNLVFQPMFNTLVPDEGPVGLPLNLDFSSDTTQSLDYQNMQQRGFISEIQGLWIDTNDAGGAITITVSVSGQRIIIPAHRQGFIALLVPNPPRFQFDCASGQVKLIFTNFPVNTAIYSTT